MCSMCLMIFSNRITFSVFVTFFVSNSLRLGYLFSWLALSTFTVALTVTRGVGDVKIGFTPLVHERNKTLCTKQKSKCFGFLDPQHC